MPWVCRGGWRGAVEIFQESRWVVGMWARDLLLSHLLVIRTSRDRVMICHVCTWIGTGVSGRNDSSLSLGGVFSAAGWWPAFQFHNVLLRRWSNSWSNVPDKTQSVS